MEKRSGLLGVIYPLEISSHERIIIADNSVPILVPY